MQRLCTVLRSSCQDRHALLFLELKKKLPCRSSDSDESSYFLYQQNCSLYAINSTCEADPTVGSCRNHNVDDSFFQCINENDSVDEERDDIDNHFTDEPDSPVVAIFESKDGVAVNIEDVLVCLV